MRGTEGYVYVAVALTAALRFAWRALRGFMRAHSAQGEVDREFWRQVSALRDHEEEQHKQRS